jgi:hypothetical protein
MVTHRRKNIKGKDPSGEYHSLLVFTKVLLTRKGEPVSNRMAVLAVCVLFASQGAGGCSIMFMDTVPMQWSPSQKLDCSGYTLPIVDISVAAGFAGMATVGFVDAIRDNELSVAGIAFGILVPAAVYATSAVFGCIWAGQCHRAEDAQKEWSRMGPGDQERFDDRWLERGDEP